MPIIGVVAIMVAGGRAKDGYDISVFMPTMRAHSTLQLIGDSEVTSCRNRNTGDTVSFLNFEEP